MVENKIKGFLNTKNKNECSGCGACNNVCPVNAIKMLEDKEGFIYPDIDENICIHCNLCHRVCYIETEKLKKSNPLYVWGGYHKDELILKESTSGGAFSAIAEIALDKGFVVFGATSKGIEVYHTKILEKKELKYLRKSKYIQSNINYIYKDIKLLLKNKINVLFSGTPCQIAGLYSYLEYNNIDNLLTVEVICEGVPSPLFIKKFVSFLENEKNKKVIELDYRYKDKNKWDFQVMRIVFNDRSIYKKDRWFNPFWSIWLQHLMSRPSCYNCLFTTNDRVADITLGDLWGVHIYCPELYNKNKGASLVLCNTERGKEIFKEVLRNTIMIGHELNFDEAIKYQGPLRKHIMENKQRKDFMIDLMDNNKSYEKICEKWNKKANFRLLLSKYIWGNRQKVFIWNLKRFFRRNDNI